MSYIEKYQFIEKKFPINEISKIALKEGNSKRPIYQLHKWWARRLSSIVRGLIIGSSLTEKHSEKDFWDAFYGQNNLSDYTIMDIFMGGGSSLVEAKKMNARTIGVDIDPMACFVTRKELEKVNFNDLLSTYETIEKNISFKIKEFYQTKINNKLYPVINYFWVYNTSCPSCETNFDAHPHYRVYHNDKEQGIICKCCGKLSIIDKKKKTHTCEYCQIKTNIDKGTFTRGKCTCPKCNHIFNLKDSIKGTENLKLFALEYENNGKREYKEKSIYDENKYNLITDEFNLLKESLFIPESKISIENEKDKRPLTHGYQYYKDLFNNRQLLSLGFILKEISKIKNENTRSWFILAFSDSLASNNMLCSYAFGYRKLTPLFGIHAYTVPARPVENNVWGTGGLGRGSFEKIFKKMIKSKTYCKNPYEIKFKNGKSLKINTGEIIESTVTNKAEQFYKNKADSLILNQSSEKLDQVKDKSVDLILTDPPYYDNLHYSHLADFYFQWIKNFIYTEDTKPLTNSLFAQKDTNEIYATFKNRLSNIFKESYLKLKDDGMMVFSYHHNKENAWKAIGEALKSNNFYISNIFPIRSEGQSAYHSSDQTIKWDSIVIVRKNIQKYSKINLEELLLNWEKEIKIKKLELKLSDKLSFFRSLGVMYYCSEPEIKLDDIFKTINSYQYN